MTRGPETVKVKVNGLVTRDSYVAVAHRGKSVLTNVNQRKKW